MTSPQSPVIIRQSSTQRWMAKPGLHADNARRRFNAIRERVGKLGILQLCLAALGLAGMGCYICTLADEHVYQSFQNWSFEQGIVGRSDVTFADYLRERMLLGFPVRGSRGRATTEITAKATASKEAQQSPSSAPAHGALLGRLEIPRLHLSAMVREGVDDKVLRTAVGHVPATALAGQRGNFAIAAHRDTLFRALKGVGSGDLVTFQTSDGSAYQYRVAATQIVKPSDVSVLRADGGGLIIDGGVTQGMPKLLTMITCYPFSYVGSAPRRFIVEARLVENEETLTETATADAPEQSIAASEFQSKPKQLIHHRSRASKTTHRSKKGASRMRRVADEHAATTSVVPISPARWPVRKKSFWRKLFGDN